MSSPKTLHLAVELDIDGARPEPDALAETVSDAERAGFAFVTFDDAPVPPPSGFRVDATVRAAYSAARTSSIGLAPTSHVLTAEPFHLAAQLASLDHATHGRAAWIVGTAATPDALATVGRAEPADLRQEVADVVETVRRLWDSWEDDAVIKDLATGRYLDPDKVHHVDFAGESFSVKGPLITPRPPQGSLVVLAAEDFADVVRPDIVLTDNLQHRRHAAPLVFGELEVRFSSAEPPTGRPRYTGDPAGLVTFLAQLDLDGVRLRPTAKDLPLLSQEVLPELRRRGLITPPEPGATLRTTLGLPRPENRFAVSSKGIA